MLAAEIGEAQDAEANGVQLETAPSGSGSHPQPTLRTTKPAAKPTKLTIKPTSNPEAKSERIPKVSKSSVAAKSKPGPKKTVVPQAKKPRNDREERLRTGHEMAAEFEAQNAGENAGPTITAPEMGQTSQPPSDEEEDGQKTPSKTMKKRQHLTLMLATTV